MARGIGLIWVYRIFMTGNRFDSRTRDFDITIFTSERVWEIKGRALGFQSLSQLGFSVLVLSRFADFPLIFSAFCFLVLGQKKKRKKRGHSELVYNNFLFRTGQFPVTIKKCNKMYLFDSSVKSHVIPFYCQFKLHVTDYQPFQFNLGI